MENIFPNWLNSRSVDRSKVSHAIGTIARAFVISAVAIFSPNGEVKAVEPSNPIHLEESFDMENGSDIKRDSHEQICLYALYEARNRTVEKYNSLKIKLYKLDKLYAESVEQSERELNEIQQKIYAFLEANLSKESTSRLKELKCRVGITRASVKRLKEEKNFMAATINEQSIYLMYKEITKIESNMPKEKYFEFQNFVQKGVELNTKWDRALDMIWAARDPIITEMEKTTQTFFDLLLEIRSRRLNATI